MERKLNDILNQMIEHLFNYETGEKEEAHMQRS